MCGGVRLDFSPHPCLYAGGTAIIGIGAVNHSAPARVAPLLGGSSSQKQSGPSFPLQEHGEKAYFWAGG